MATMIAGDPHSDIPPRDGNPLSPSISTMIAGDLRSDIPGVDDPDDIPEVIAPAGAYAPLVVDQYQELLSGLRSLSRAFDSGFEGIPLALQKQSALLALQLTQWHDTLSATEAGALQRLCESIEKLTGGITVSAAPYTCTMQALTVQGFPVSVTITRQTFEEFLKATTGIAAWFVEQGYTAPPAAVAF